MGRKSKAAPATSEAQAKLNKYVVYIRKGAWDALHREKAKLQGELGISLTNTQALTLILLRLGKEESGD